MRGRQIFRIVQLFNFNNNCKNKHVNIIGLKLFCTKNAFFKPIYPITQRLFSLEHSNNEENDSRSEVKNKSSRFASAAAGLLLMFWAKSQWDVVQAAKPIYKDDSDDATIYRRHQNDEKLDKGIIKKKSNRQQYNFIADVVEMVSDTVVSIDVKDHSLVDFYTGTPQTVSNGSGFIISEDGLILTNAHVVAAKKRSSFSVRLSDGRTFSAVVENIDHESDLATIRIQAKNLPTLSLGCSSDTKLGEWVVAVGAPLKLTNTITAGIVSSTSRSASELGFENGINYIQTDAAITFGNSGGPLINLDGEAIGINSMKVADGISFAIPIDHAKHFLAKSKADGIAAPRRYLGITILTVTEQIKRQLESRGYKKVSNGVLVWQIVVGSPAYLAGIQPGDIIVRINGIEVKSSAEMYEIIAQSDKLLVHVQRGENLYSCTITPEQVVDN